ncbi:MAG TPA: rhodanese-like domain-containing protein [Gammaproteobacteria bacterium]|nr:rhodanese-like domain-containing protein [Gammaproteobacteria bacterium]
MNLLVEFANKHPLIVAGLVAAWLAVMFYELKLRSRGLTHVSANDAVRLINKGALVIDVREPAKFEAGHIVNARNVVLDRLQRDEDAVDKKKNKVLLTVCDNGSLSAKAAGLLRKAGYENVFSLRGGLGTWRTENLPLVK